MAASARIPCRFIAEVIGPAFCICWICYCLYAALLGPNGYRALRQLSLEQAARSAELHGLAKRRTRLEVIADQLNPRGLDPDMADEKIRSVLGYVAEGDIVIPRDQLDELLKDARSEAGPRAD